MVLDGEEDEFILGMDVLSTLGIDINRQLESLAARSNEDDDDSTLPDDADPTTVDAPEELMRAIEDLVERAVNHGFPPDLVEELRRIVKRFDVWRLTLGRDPPAHVPPLQIRLKEGATPYRCKARKYPPHLSKFLQEFNDELEALGLVYKNNDS